MEKLNYIVIDGLVRTGKTDLAHVIAEEFNSKIILDDKNNPFADEFYMSLAEGEKFLREQGYSVRKPNENELFK